jgi:hypothetical protein
MLGQEPARAEALNLSPRPPERSAIRVVEEEQRALLPPLKSLQQGAMVG